MKTEFHSFRFLLILSAIFLAGCATDVPFVNRPRADVPRQRNFVIPLEEGVSMRFVWCPPGTFTMGTPRKALGRFRWMGTRSVYGEETPHLVTLTHGFWISETPVTTEQWTALVRSDVSADRHPLATFVLSKAAMTNEFVSATWDQSLSFCGLVNEAAPQIVRGYEFTLPTEAEWEWACRAGSTNIVPFKLTQDDIRRVDDTTNLLFAAQGTHKTKVSPKMQGAPKSNGASRFRYSAQVFTNTPNVDLDALLGRPSNQWGIPLVVKPQWTADSWSIPTHRSEEDPLFEGTEEEGRHVLRGAVLRLPVLPRLRVGSRIPGKPTIKMPFRIVLAPIRESETLRALVSGFTYWDNLDFQELCESRLAMFRSIVERTSLSRETRGNALEHCTALENYLNANRLGWNDLANRDFAATLLLTSIKAGDGLLFHRILSDGHVRLEGRLAMDAVRLAEESPSSAFLLALLERGVH